MTLLLRTTPIALAVVSIYFRCLHACLQHFRQARRRGDASNNAFHHQNELQAGPVLKPTTLVRGILKTVSGLFRADLTRYVCFATIVAYQGRNLRSPVV